MSKLIIFPSEDPYIRIDPGEYYDAKVNGQTFRICGEARIWPERGYVWFAYPGENGMFMNLNDWPTHGAPSPSA